MQFTKMFIDTISNTNNHAPSNINKYEYRIVIRNEFRVEDYAKVVYTSDLHDIHVPTVCFLHDARIHFIDKSKNLNLALRTYVNSKYN